MKNLFIHIILGVMVFCMGTDAQAQNWASLDAVTYNSASDKYHFFFGSYYVTKERGKPIDGLAMRIEDGWQGYPSKWKNGSIDAVLYNADNDCYYFFRGDEYARKPRGKAFDKGPIKFNASGSGFKGIPFDRIDAACYNANTDKYYFFSGGKWVTKKRGEPVSGKAKTVGVDGWKGCPYSNIPGVVYNPDNEAYYFFDHSTYAKKKQGESFSGSTRPYNHEKSGFKWMDRPSNPFVGVIHDGGYVANFKVTWEANGRKDSWESGNKSFGFSKLVNLPANSINITVESNCFVMIGKQKQIFKESMRAPSNKWYKVYGTTAKPKFKAQSQGGSSMGKVSDFFTKDVADAVASSGEFLAQAIEDGSAEIMRSKAMQDLSGYGQLIDQVAKAAKAAWQNDKQSLDALGRVAKQKSANMAHGTMQALANSHSFRDCINTARGESFASFSYGVGADAAKVIGVEGSYGFAIAIPNLADSRAFFGVGGSLGVQVGASGECQFGFWKVPPSSLGGPYLSLQVEVAGEVGMSITLIYDMTHGPKLAGLVIGVSAGVEAGGSIGGGYTWILPG